MPHPVASEVRVLAPKRAMISVPKINSSRVPVIKSVQKKVGDKRMMKPMEKVVHKAQKRDARVAALPKKSVVRRPPPPRRSVQPLPAVVQDQDVGKLAQQKKLTLLERKCVSSEVQGQYGQYLSRFEDFCRVSGFQWPPALQDVDPLLSDYMDTLFMEGRSPHEGEKTFAALEFHMLEVKGKLHRARRCLKGWRKAVPAQSRLPMPMLAMFGIAMTLAAGNHLEMALKTVVDFLLYLRPGEGLDLRSRNVVAPVRGAGIQYKWVTVIIRDQEGQRPDKTGVFDNSLAIDHTLWAGEQLLLRAKKAPTKDSLIFNFSMDNSRREAGVGKPTPLPAATRGGDGGPVLPSKGVQCRQSPWALEERRKCETLCKGGHGAGVAQPTHSCTPQVLPVGREEHGQSVHRGIASQDAPIIDVSQVDVFSMKKRPRHFILEIFAGTARISSALRKVGLPTFPIDIDIYPSHDVLDPECAHSILNWIAGGRVMMVWLGMPCTTFSQARRNDGVGPLPLRDELHLWGLPNLKRHDARKLAEGNQLFNFTMKVLHLCQHHHVPTSWKTPSHRLHGPCLLFRSFVNFTNLVSVTSTSVLMGRFGKNLHA